MKFSNPRFHFARSNRTSFHNPSIFGIAIISLMLVITGCQLNTYDENYYRVKDGDTLIGIASRYGMSYREIARLNNLRSPYLIKERQKLRVTPY